MSVWERVQTWYRGKYVPPPRNDPDSPIVIISPGHYEQPLIAKLLGAMGRFWLRHWKWIIATSLVIIGMLIKAYGKL